MNPTYNVGDTIGLNDGVYRFVQISERAKDGSKKIVLQQVVEKPVDPRQSQIV